MNKETCEVLKEVLKKARAYHNKIYGKRKRLKRDELWDSATFLRDVIKIDGWIDEVSKEYQD